MLRFSLRLEGRPSARSQNIYYCITVLAVHILPTTPLCPTSLTSPLCIHHDVNPCLVEFPVATRAASTDRIS